METNRIGNYLHLYRDKWLNCSPQHIKGYSNPNAVEFYEIAFEKDLPEDVLELLQNNEWEDI